MVGYEMLAEAQRDLTAEQVRLSLCLPVSRSVCLSVLRSVECSADWLEVDSDLCQPRPVHSPDSPHLAHITSLLSPSPLSQSVIPSVLLQAYNPSVLQTFSSIVCSLFKTATYRTRCGLNSLLIGFFILFAYSRLSCTHVKLLCCILLYCIVLTATFIMIIAVL